MISLGSQYVIGLKAVNCETGDVLAEEQEQAAGQGSGAQGSGRRGNQSAEQAGRIAQLGTEIRHAVGGSDHAIAGGTESLQPGTRRRLLRKGTTPAMPFYQRAVELDPNFASAYAAIAGVYSHRSEVGLAAENARKAYELREKVSERERLRIEAFYYITVTGELEKAAQVYELWQQTYPRDYLPWAASSFVSAGLGNWEKALEEAREAIRLEPNNGINYTNLALIYANLNRLDRGGGCV